MQCICDPEFMGGHRYIQFIGTYFRICAYSPRDVVGFVSGLFNIGCWILAQLPQLIENYRNKTGESLSIPFLIIWLIGDFANFLGCILTNQSKIQLYTSIYFLIMDTLVLGQFFYYRNFYRGPRPTSSGNEHASLLNNGDEKLPADVLSDDYLQDNTTPQLRSTPTISSSSRLPTMMLICMTIISMSSIYMAESHPLLQLAYPAGLTQPPLTLESPLSNPFLDYAKLTAPICDKTSDGSTFSRVIGTFFAWVCSLMYFTSRIPQCIHNIKRQSVRGLSFALFFMSFLANVFYGIAVLVPNTTDMRSTGFWQDTLAYLIGSLGANIFNFMIIVQFWYYKGQEPVTKSGDSHHDTYDEHHTRSEARNDGLEDLGSHQVYPDLHMGMHMDDLPHKQFPAHKGDVQQQRRVLVQPLHDAASVNSSR